MVSAIVRKTLLNCGEIVIKPRESVSAAQSDVKQMHGFVYK